MATPEFHDLAIKTVTPLTADAVSLTFEIPDGLQNAFKFTPGQYLTLRATVNGEDIRRSYSICSPAGSEDVSVGIKRLEGGAFSEFATDLEPGDRLQVMSPQGRFTAPLGGKHNYLLLAAGSGVTPILSIARSVLESEPDSTVTFCYANRATDSVMFKGAVEDLKDRFMTRFLLTHLMTQEAQDIELFNGRLDGDKIQTMAARGLIAPSEYDGVYICGPQGMVDSVSEALVALGVDQSKLHSELFVPPTPLQPKHERPEITTAGTHKVAVVLNGSERQFRMHPTDRLIEAAQGAGLELPYSCANGMCATCRCKLAKGAGEMRQNFSLEDWEMKAGYVLACQFVPKTDEVLLDFDAS